MAETGGGRTHNEGAGGYRWQWRDAVIAALALGLAGSLWWAFGGRVEPARDEAAGAEQVGLFEVVIDREGRQWLELVFDRPVLAEGGEVGVGDVLGQPPATVDPPLGGSWRWRERNVLRFEPSGGFAPATAYAVDLIPERFLAAGQSFAGDTEVAVRIDQFLVEGVEVWEEPESEGGAVVLRGNIRFNYNVEPETLAGLIRLEDPRTEQDPEIQLEAGWRNRSIPFRSTPVAKEKQPRQVVLTIDAALTPAEGNVPLGETYAQPVPIGSIEVLEVRQLTATPGLGTSTLRLVLSSTVAADLAAPYLHVEPETAYRLSTLRNSLVLTGAFEPGATYRVRLDKGLPAGDGATLRQAYDARVRLDNLAPSVAFQSQGLFLSRGGLRNLALETVNVDRLSLAVDRVYRNNLFLLFQGRGDFDQEEVYPGGVWRPLGDRLYEETVAVAGQRNRKATTVLSLDDYVDADEPGLYRVLAGRPDHWQAPQRWVLVTDLGAVAKRGDGEFLVWALSHRTLAPVAGAEVELISDQNQVIARGTTDGEGLWRFRDATALAEHEPFLLTLARGDDFSFLYLDRMRVDTTGLDVGGAARPVDGYSAFLYGERDLYRPGETVRGVALVRDAGLRPAPAMPALLRHRDSRGREIQARRIELDGRGLAEFEWPMPAYAMTGRQSLELEIAEVVVGRYAFQLEEFVPDRIKVEIRPGDATAGPGRPLSWDVAGAYLFGPPAAGLAAETRVRLVDDTFSSERYPRFSFRNDEHSFSDREVFSQDARLDGEGRAAFEVELPAERRLPSSLAAVITARVQEQGGRGVTARTRVGLDPYPYHVGLRRPASGYPDIGQEVSFDWVAVAPDGSDHPSGALEAELILDRWQTVLRRTPAGGFRYQSTRESVTVERRKIGAGDATGTVAFRPQQYGSHRVVLTDPATGASASVQFYTGGWGYSPWAVENPDRLELELDRDEYRAGETATVQVRAPFPGRLLLTVEQEEILEVRSFRLEGNTATIRLPMRGSYRPNAYLTATLVRGVEAIEPGAVGRAFGAVPLNVERGSNRLEVTLEAPAELRSASRLEVAVASAPGAAVTVAAVDEGILQLIAQRTPDPFAFFYRKLRLGVRSYDTFSLLLPEIEAPAAVGGGEGGPGEAQYVRSESIRRVKPVAFWSGVLETDASGRARAEFQLPEFAGAVRLMAVASDRDRFGSAEATTRVRDPLVLTPTLPRILSFGETLEVPVTVRNDTGRPGRFEVGLTVAGAATLSGETSGALELPDGAERTAWFTVATGLEEGSVRFAFSASGNGERAAAEVAVDVRPDLPPQATSLGGALTDAETELPAPEAAFRQGSVRRRLQIGSLPLVRFGRQLSDLVRYPYGCMEQTLSRAFPLIYLEELAQEFEPELLDPAKGGTEPAALVDDALRRVAYHQVDGGGFALWRGGREPHPWTSVYASHFLIEARRAGYATDPQLESRALGYLRGLVRAKNRYGSDELERAVYALYVLSRAGEAELGVMDFLRERQSSSMTRASRALLAAAYAGVGNRDAVDELAAGLADVERVERDTGRNFRSTVRDRAMLLMALEEADPESAAIPALVERLGRDAKGIWTTQETAFTLIAIGQLVRRQRDRPPFAGTVWVGDRRLGRFTSDETAVFDGMDGAGAVRIVLDEGYQPGSAFYTLTTRGIPRDAAYRPLAEGLEVERFLLDRDGREIDPDAVRQGDLIVVKTRVRSVAGPVDNVVVQQLLPSGLEVENARLETTETLPWVTDANLAPDSVDLRDDRVLVFTSLPADSWQTLYSLTRAVAPGSFRLPPVHAEAMYNPALRASGASAAGWRWAGVDEPRSPSVLRDGRALLANGRALYCLGRASPPGSPPSLRSVSSCSALGGYHSGYALRWRCSDRNRSGCALRQAAQGRSRRRRFARGGARGFGDAADPGPALSAADRGADAAGGGDGPGRRRRAAAALPAGGRSLAAAGQPRRAAGRAAGGGDRRRGLAVLSPSRGRPAGRPARHLAEPPRRARGLGRLDPADAARPAGRAGPPHPGRQTARGGAGGAARAPVLEAPAARAVPQSGALRRQPRRGRGRQPLLLRQAAGGAVAGGDRPAGGVAALTQPLRPDPRSRSAAQGGAGGAGPGARPAPRGRGVRRSPGGRRPPPAAAEAAAAGAVHRPALHPLGGGPIAGGDAGGHHTRPLDPAHRRGPGDAAGCRAAAAGHRPGGGGGGRDPRPAPASAGRLGGLPRAGAGGAGRRRPGPPVAGLDPQAVPLRPGRRPRPDRPRQLSAGRADRLRRLRGRELRRPIQRPGDGARGAAPVAQRTGGAAAGAGRSGTVPRASRKRRHLHPRPPRRPLRAAPGAGRRRGQPGRADQPLRHPGRWRALPADRLARAGARLRSAGGKRRASPRRPPRGRAPAVARDHAADHRDPARGGAAGPARRLAAGARRAGGGLEDRHLLRPPRRLGGGLLRPLHDRRLGGQLRRRGAAGHLRLPARGAAAFRPVPGARAGRRRDRPVGGSAHRKPRGLRPEPPTAGPLVPEPGPDRLPAGPVEARAVRPPPADAGRRRRRRRAGLPPSHPLPRRTGRLVAQRGAGAARRHRRGRGDQPVRGRGAAHRLARPGDALPTAPRRPSRAPAHPARRPRRARRGPALLVSRWGAGGHRRAG